MRLDGEPRANGENGATRSALDNLPQPTVWQHDDAAIQRLEANPSQSHWSLQTTQPLAPRWSPHLRRQLAAERAAMLAGRESRALGIGAGLGVLLALVALGLALLLAVASGWPPGSAPDAPDSAQPPIPVRSTPHTTNPAATNIPTSTTLPTVTAQPTATFWPTPTARPTQTPRPAPTRTPRPAPTPTPPPTSPTPQPQPSP